MRSTTEPNSEAIESTRQSSTIESGSKRLIRLRRGLSDDRVNVFVQYRAQRLTLYARVQQSVK
jgi:hypothetical protein